MDDLLFFYSTLYFRQTYRNIQKYRNIVWYTFTFVKILNSKVKVDLFHSFVFMQNRIKRLETKDDSFYGLDYF